MPAMGATRPGTRSETGTAGTGLQQTFNFVGNLTGNKLGDGGVVGEWRSPRIKNGGGSTIRAVHVKGVIEAIVNGIPLKGGAAALALTWVLLWSHRLTPLTYPKREWIFYLRGMPDIRIARVEGIITFVMRCAWEHGSGRIAGKQRQSSNSGIGADSQELVTNVPRPLW